MFAKSMESMMRLLLALSLVFSAGAVQAEATDKAEQCDALGGIVTQLVELRQDGKREKRSVKILTKGKTAVDEKYQPAVQFLSGWVYSLTDDELTYEPGKKYTEACLEQ